MENNKIYQTVLDSVISIGITHWDKLIFYIQYDDGSFEMKFYIKQGDSYKDCFSLGIPDKTIVNMFLQLDKEFEKIRKQISDDKNELWTVMTIAFDADLHFKADFDYSFIEDDLEYKANWKKKYLK